MRYRNVLAFCVENPCHLGKKFDEKGVSGPPFDPPLSDHCCRRKDRLFSEHATRATAGVTTPARSPARLKNQWLIDRWPPVGAVDQID